MSTAFVAGATGYTGQAVVRALVERGVTTFAHVRPDSKQIAEYQQRFRTIGAKTDTTAWVPSAMRESLERVRPTHVFALLGTTRARGQRNPGTNETYETIDYGLTKLLLDACVGCGTRPRFVYLSSVGVSESTRSEYLKVRWRLEQDLARSGLPYAVARPSFISGDDRPEERPLERLSAKFFDATLSVAKALGGRSFADRYRSMDATTLAQALIRLGLDEQENRIFDAEFLRL